MRIAYKSMRIFLYLAMTVSGFLNLLTAAGLLLRGNMVGFAWILIATIVVGFALITALCIKRKWLWAGFTGLACTVSIMVGYTIFVHKMTIVFYTGHLHIVLVPLFAFLTALFYRKVHRSSKKWEEERPLRDEESLLGGQPL